MGHRCVGFKAPDEPGSGPAQRPAQEPLVKSMRWAHTRAIIDMESQGVDA
jgi:hypothetical protein